MIDDAKMMQVPELDDISAGSPNFDWFLAKVKSGIETVGKESAVPIVLGGLFNFSAPVCLLFYWSGSLSFMLRQLTRVRAY